MKKASLLLFALLLPVLLCSCKDNDEPSAFVPNYSFSASQSTSSATEPTPVPTTLPTMRPTALGILDNTIWDDFAAEQKAAGTGTVTTAKSEPVNVFNYPMKTVLSYFTEIAFASESEGYIGYIRKWEKPVYYEIYGTADDEDVAVVKWLASQLNTVNGFPGMHPADAANKANVKYYFGNTSYVQTQLSYADPTVKSFNRFYWITGKYSILLSKIGIATDTTSRKERNSRIMEETLQMLGLAQDSAEFPQSLFYRSESMPQAPDELDWTLLRLLYLPDVKVGMNESDAITAAGKYLVSYYATGVVYTEPKLDFKALALQYAGETTSDGTTDPSATDPSATAPSTEPTEPSSPSEPSTPTDSSEPSETNPPPPTSDIIIPPVSNTPDPPTESETPPTESEDPPSEPEDTSTDPSAITIVFG